MSFGIVSAKVQQQDDGRWKAEIEQLGISEVAETEQAARAALKAKVMAKASESGREKSKIPTEKEQQPDGSWKIWWPEVGIAGFGATEEEAGRDFASQLQAAMSNPAVREAVTRLSGPPPSAAAAARPETKIPEAYAALPNVTAADFETTIAGETPVLLDFWAEWCQPCLQMAPSLVALQEELGDRLRVAKVDVQTEIDLARQCEIGAVPILLLYRKGELLHRIVGARGLESLRSELAPFLV